MSASLEHTAIAVDQVDTRFLESLMGYNARRASLSIIGQFLDRMAVYDLRPVDFSVLVLVDDNPGITSRQICATLSILPPNLVGMVNALEGRALLERKPHPNDRRAQGLHIAVTGQAIMGQARKTAVQLEREATRRLSAAERKTLMQLLQKIYL